MVTINDKISLIIDVDNLFALNDPKVQDMINGDAFIIDELYKNSLEYVKNMSWVKFKHLISKEIMALDEWVKYYQCDMNNPKSIVIFLRLAEPILI